MYEQIAQVRSARSAYKQRVIDATLTYDSIFAEAANDPVLADMKLLPLIESIPEIGKVRSRRALESCEIAETCKVGSFDADTQEALREALGLPRG